MIEQAALRIYQDLLDHMGDSLVAGDAPRFLRHVLLPCHVITETETIIIDSPAKADRHFHGFHGALMAQRVDAYTRIASEAQFLAPDRIRGQHQTIITSAGKTVVPRFDNEMEITRRDGIWGIAFVRHHTRYVAWPDVLPRGGGQT